MLSISISPRNDVDLSKLMEYDTGFGIDCWWEE